LLKSKKSAKEKKLEFLFHCRPCCFSSRSARKWWSQTGSNRRPPACKAGALPAELWPHFDRSCSRLRQSAVARAPTLPGVPGFRGSFDRRGAVYSRYTSREDRTSRGILVGLGRFELPTSPLSGVRSNQLSYRPGDVRCPAARRAKLGQLSRAVCCDQIICEGARAFDY
jgi:hypothetical protein